MLLLNDDDKHPLMVCVCGCNLCKISHEDAIIVPMVFFACALIIHSGRMVEICCCCFSFVHHHTFIFSFFFNIQTSIGSGIFSLLLWFFFSFKNFNLFNSKCKFTNKQIIMMMNGDNSFFFLPIMLCGCQRNTKILIIIIIM